MSKKDALYELKKTESAKKLLSLMCYYFKGNELNKEVLDAYFNIFLKSFFRLLETEEEVVVSDLGTFKKTRVNNEYKLSFTASTIAKNVVNNCGKYYNKKYEKIVPKEQLDTIRKYERYIDLQLKKRELAKNEKELLRLQEE